MTRIQSNSQWSGGVATHPAPENSECKNPLENFSPRFFGIKRASSTLIISQRDKLSTRSIAHLCWCKWRIFWRKTQRGKSPMVSCSCTTMPRLTGLLHPRRNWPTWASNVLITQPILRIWPRQTITCSLDWKTIWKSPFFVDAYVIFAAETCFDGQNSECFWVACKSWSKGLKSVLSFVESTLNKSRVWSL